MARLLRPLALGALFAVAMWVFVTAWSDFRADGRSAAARQATAAWVGGERRGPDRAAHAQALASLQAALQIQPQDPSLHESLGDLQMVAAQQPWPTAEERAQQLAAATGHYRRTLDIRPRDARTWAALAMAQLLQGQRGPSVNEAWEQARKNGPHEGYVMRQLFFVVIAGWDEASPAMRQWATDLYENGSKAQREAINRFAREHGLEFSSDQAPRP
jgi:tetratricopeptide (TPR) repeat protein